MVRFQTSRHPKAKSILRLPDLERSKSAALHSPGAATSQESCRHAIWRSTEGVRAPRRPSIRVKSYPLRSPQNRLKGEQV